LQIKLGAKSSHIRLEISAKIKIEKKVVYSVYSSVTGSAGLGVAAFAASSAVKPFAARLAIAPSLVAGVYAPPANVKLHLPHFQTPTLSR